MTARPAPLPAEDEPLVGRLRETFRLEAEAVAPFTGRYRSIAAIHDWRARRRAARRRAAGAILAVAAVAAVTAAGVSAAVVANRPAGTNVVAAPGIRSGVIGRLHQARSMTPTVGAASVPEVPASFAPLAATFVTSDIGYTLGTVACPWVRCLTLAGTLDGGRTWTDLGTPVPAGTTLGLPASGPIALSMRFSDQDDGWIYGNVGTQYVLWWTGDAGHTWRAVGQKVTGGGSVTALEATGGRAQAAVVRGAPAGVTVISSAQSSTTWSQTSPRLRLAGTTTPATDLVLQQQGGWLVVNAPTFVSGARLASPGRWVPWTPVAASGATVHLAADSATDVFEAAQPAQGAAGAALYHSTDGGLQWSSIARLPAGLRVEALAAPTVGTVAVAGADGGRTVIQMSDDSWLTAQTVWSGSGPVSELGFEDAQQGIALIGSRLLMTYDGGAHWAGVDFQHRPPQ